MFEEGKNTQRIDGQTERKRERDVKGIIIFLFYWVEAMDGNFLKLLASVDIYYAFIYLLLVLIERGTKRDSI